MRLRGHHPLLRTALLLGLSCALTLALGGGIAQATSYGLGTPPSIGTSGTGSGQLNEPKGVAVEQSSGDFYVVDSANLRVEKFKPNGEFDLMFGGEVNQTAVAESATRSAEEDVCPAPGHPGDTCGVGIHGSGNAQFGNLCIFGCVFGPVGIAIDPVSGDVYVADTYNNRVQYFGSSGNYLGQFDGTGAPEAFGSHKLGGLAIDSSGHVYVADSNANVVDRFSSTGTYQCQITGLATPSASECNAGGSQTPQGGFALHFNEGGFENLTADLAVDAAGDLYVADTGNLRVDIFGSSGAYREQISPSLQPSAVAVDGAGRAFVTSEGSSVQLFDPSSSLTTPVTEFGSGTIGTSYGLAVANSTGNLYVGDKSNNMVWNFVPIVPPTCATDTPATNVTSTSATVPGVITTNGLGTSYSFEYGLTTGYGQSTGTIGTVPGTTASEAVAGPITSLQPNQTYHYQLVINFGSSADCGDQTLVTNSAAPAVDGESTSAVAQTSATLQAQINPNNQATTYQFQYVDAAHYSTGNYSAGATIPASPGSVGSGFGDQPASAPTGAVLALNTTYHYRVLATNTTNTTDGADQTFTTLPATPTATTNLVDPSTITQTSATLPGTLNGQGADTHWYFRYVDDAHYTPAAPNPYGAGGTAPGPGLFVGDAGVVSADTPVSTDLAGLQPNTTYHYQLVACNVTPTFGSCSPSSNQAFGADQTFITLALPPVVHTGLPTGLGPDTATVHGSVTPQGAATTYHLEYVDAAGYEEAAPNPYAAGAATTAADAGSATSAQSVAIALTGLAPNTTYHYRIDATNNGGTTLGEDQTLTTYGIAPTVETGAASNLGATTATLAGGLDPQGSDTSYRFQYGTTTNYGAGAPVPEAGAGAGTGPQAVSTDLSGLQPATTYHYRLIAINGSGVSYGADRTFTTQAGPPPPPPAAGHLALPTRAAVQNGAASLGVQCGGDPGSSCAGRLSLTLGKTKLGTAGYSVNAGQGATVEVNLNRAARRLLAKAKHNRLSVLATATPSASGAEATSRKLTLSEPGRRRNKAHSKRHHKRATHTNRGGAK